MSEETKEIKVVWVIMVMMMAAFMYTALNLRHTLFYFTYKNSFYLDNSCFMGKCKNLNFTKVETGVQINFFKVILLMYSKTTIKPRQSGLGDYIPSPDTVVPLMGWW